MMDDGWIDDDDVVCLSLLLLLLLLLMMMMATTYVKPSTADSPLSESDRGEFLLTFENCAFTDDEWWFDVLSGEFFRQVSG